MNAAERRAEVLISQSRWDLAESELRQALIADSDNPYLHELLAICMLGREHYDAAEAEARQAIRLDPGRARSHLTMAAVLTERRQYKVALSAIDEAIELDPRDIRGYELRARLYCALSQWKQALQAANQGLRLDPENIECQNWRSFALNKLGNRESAVETIQTALHRDPEDSLTHANLGWQLLEAGQRDQALVHFREALRLNPENSWARSGVVEGLKSRNFIYRWLLAYFLFMAKLSPRAQWGIIVGGFLLQRALGDYARNNPEAAVYVMPVLIAYLAFALMTWLGYPLFNLMLLSDRDGRMVLTDDDRRGALTVSGVLLTAMALGIVGWRLGPEDEHLVAKLINWSAFNLALLSMPTAVLFQIDAGSSRRTMALYTAALGILGLMPLFASVAMVAKLNFLAHLISAGVRLTTQFYVLGIIASQFLGNYLASRTVTR